MNENLVRDIPEITSHVNQYFDTGKITELECSLSAEQILVEHLIEAFKIIDRHSFLAVE